MKRLIALCFAIVIPAMVLTADDAKLAPELRKGASNQMVSVILQYRSAPERMHQTRIESLNGNVRAHLGLINSLRVQVPVRELAALSADADVAYISPDRAVRSHLNNATPAVLANYAWGLGLGGARVGVAVIDSGIHQVDDVGLPGGESRIKYSFDFVGDGPDDGYGHGTHVAGIIGGNGIDSSCSACTVAIKGVAPNVDLISLRVLNNQGEGSDSNVIQAIQAAISLKSAYNIRVINLSIGRPVFESYKLDPLCQAVE